MICHLNRRRICRLIAAFTVALAWFSVSHASDDVMQALNATYKITNADSTATAFVISHVVQEKRVMVLVTAAHVLEKMTGDECRFVYRRPRSDGTFARREFPIKIREDQRELWTRHAKADVAALRIELPDGHGVQPIVREQILDTSSCDDCGLQLGDAVWVLGYPAQLESSRSGFPVLRRGTVASFPLKESDKTRTFMVDYTTFRGDSGGPVFRRNLGKDESSGPTIVGLIHGQHRETTKSFTPNEERTVHRPMGLAIVVHAKFINETIDQLK